VQNRILNTSVKTHLWKYSVSNHLDSKHFKGGIHKKYFSKENTGDISSGHPK